MPTLSEVQEHAADAEHQAFQRAYDALLNVAKDPITCRHFWDAGFTAGQADANDMLTIAHMDGYSKGRDAMQRELVEALEAVVPPMPPTDAFCHNHITTQDKCPNCQRLARAHALLTKHRGQS